MNYQFFFLLYKCIQYLFFFFSVLDVPSDFVILVFDQ